MKKPTQNDQTAALLELLDSYHAAMVDASIEKLEPLLSPDYALSHINGYEQPKAEWFNEIVSRQFDYHRIDIDITTIIVEVDGHAATLRGRGVFNATINGMRSPWRLAFSLTLTKLGADWCIHHARYQRY